MPQKKNQIDPKPRRRWRRHRMLFYFIASVIALVVLVAVDLLFLKRLFNESP